MSKFDENIFSRIALFNNYISKVQLEECVTRDGLDRHRFEPIVDDHGTGSAHQLHRRVGGVAIDGAAAVAPRGRRQNHRGENQRSRGRPEAGTREGSGYRGGARADGRAGRAAQTSLRYIWI